MTRPIFTIVLLLSTVIGFFNLHNASAQESGFNYTDNKLSGAQRFAVRSQRLDSGRDLADVAVAYFGEVVCPFAPAEFGCGCYLDGFKMPCDLVANCLQAGFCAPASPSIDVLLQEAAVKGPFQLVIKPSEAKTVATCSSDDISACDMLAAACEKLKGVGQCGGPNNPDGCECVY